MNFLITGGAGFIGANLAIRLVKAHPQDHFIVLDKLTYAGNLANLEPVKGAANLTFVQGDICDAKLMNELMKKVEAVVNLAAESHVDRSIESAQEFIRTNVVGVQTLLDAALANEIKKFVQVSTDEVYGSLGPDDPPFEETTALAPNSPYAASKAAADLLVRANVETYGLPGIITRCSNNYGPFQFPEKLIPLMLTNALESKPLPVYGDGQNIRDWIFVEDHCRGLEKALFDGQPGQIYNFGGNCELTNLELIERLLSSLAQVTGQPVESYRELIEFVADRPGHDRRYAMAFERTTQRLGWRPKTELDQGLKEPGEWYLARQDWWRAVKSGQYRDYYERQYGGRAILSPNKD